MVPFKAMAVRLTQPTARTRAGELARVGDVEAVEAPESNLGSSMLDPPFIQNSIHRSDRDGMISGACLFVNRLGARPAVRRFDKLFIQRLQIFSAPDSCEELLEPRIGRLVTIANGDQQPLFENLGISRGGERKRAVELPHFFH